MYPLGYKTYVESYVLVRVSNSPSLYPPSGMNGGEHPLPESLSGAMVNW
jgi:hypothetical protein